MPHAIANTVIGAGSPIVDLLVHVKDEFLAGLEGDKGGMELVDAEAMAKILAAIDDEPVMAPGGSAANTLCALGRLGAPVAFLGTLGDDADGAFYQAAFEKLGGDSARFRKTMAAQTARCLSMITPDYERTMRTDLGAAALLDPDGISAKDFDGCGHLHAEGYLLFNRALAEAVLKSAKEAGCTVSLDLGAFEVVRASQDILERLLRDYVDCVFANEDEAEAFCGHTDYEKAADQLAELCDTAAVKLGADGAILRRNGESVRVGANRVAQVVDTTGAGDCWAAGFLYGHLQGWPLEQCGELGALLGAGAVQTIGASPDEDAWKAIHTYVAGAPA